ncbi:GTP binding protein HflX [Brucella suis bv. 5 str. 513]|nr:GTP binding protein HflX [Brucella suis bv. 5 str. 513]
MKRNGTPRSSTEPGSFWRFSVNARAPRKARFRWSWRISTTRRDALSEAGPTLNASAAVGASLAARVKPRSKLTDACFRKKSCASSASLKPWCARALHRQKRRKVPHPIVALVGYTNAGKSTLFNRMTGAQVLAEDMLFATLDPTLRRIRLPHGETVILSDTVGFISNLPHHLVAAFRATLEEVVEADLILHVRDISDPDNAAQAEDVENILAGLGIEPQDHARVVEVWNKIDNLDESAREAALRLAAAGSEEGRPIPVSAITGEGVDRLLSLIETRIAGALGSVDLVLSPFDLHLLDWIYQHGSDVQRENLEDGSVRIKARLTEIARRMLDEKRGIRPEKPEIDWE